MISSAWLCKAMITWGRILYLGIHKIVNYAMLIITPKIMWRSAIVTQLFAESRESCDINCKHCETMQWLCEKLCGKYQIMRYCSHYMAFGIIA